MLTPSGFTYRTASLLRNGHVIWSASNDEFTDLLFDELCQHKPEPEPEPPAPSPREPRPYYHTPFAIWFRGVWQESGKNQREIARCLGLSQGTVGAIITGKHRPSMESVHQIAVQWGLDFEDLWEKRNRGVRNEVPDE